MTWHSKGPYENLLIPGFRKPVLANLDRAHQPGTKVSQFKGPERNSPGYGYSYPDSPP